MPIAAQQSATNIAAAFCEGLTPAECLAKHVGIDLHKFGYFRALNSEFVRYTLAEVFETFQPSDFARCLAEHPREAVKLILGYVSKNWALILQAQKINPTSYFTVVMHYNPAPNGVSDLVATHIAPPVKLIFYDDPSLELLITLRDQINIEIAKYTGENPAHISGAA